jgi:hypothetical protein
MLIELAEMRRAVHCTVQLEISEWDWSPPKKKLWMKLLALKMQYQSLGSTRRFAKAQRKLRCVEPFCDTPCRSRHAILSHYHFTDIASVEASSLANSNRRYIIVLGIPVA